MKSFVVIGLGRFGSAVAKTIAETEADLLVMDQNEDRVNLFKDIVPDLNISYVKHIHGGVEIASGDTRLMIGDSLFVIGRPEDIKKLSEQN